MGVIEAEAKAKVAAIIDDAADDTLQKMREMKATPTEMALANVIARKVTEVITQTARHCQSTHGVDPVRIHQLALYIAMRAEQAVTKCLRHDPSPGLLPPCRPCPPHVDQTRR